MRMPFLNIASQEPISTISQFPQLVIKIGQSRNFDCMSNTLKLGLESMGLKGCFLISCFGFNRETRFGQWQSHYVFPLKSDLSEAATRFEVRDDLMIVGSGYFTLVVGDASQRLDSDPAIADSLVMLAESTRLWVKGYTKEVDQEFDSLNHRRASCKQLLDVVKQLDASGSEITATHRRIVTAVNVGIPEGIEALQLSANQQATVMDEFDEISREYSIFAKQQMELNHQLKEQVRAVASFLLAHEK